MMARVPFVDARQARADFERISKLLSPVLLETLVSLLGHAPDPDGALNQLERLLSGERSTEIRQLFHQHPASLHFAVVVFATSKWLGETLIQNTDLFHTLDRDRSLEKTRSVDDYREAFARFRARAFDSDVALLLARFKRREYVRILLRDVLEIATLAEFTSEISALSDALIERALRACENDLQGRYGLPQFRGSDGRCSEVPFCVLAMGKLGGNELNYSSDIDLLYLYGDGEDAGMAAISVHEYFVRLAQQLTDTLSRVTGEGPVFRIDLRLRPQGGQGELAMPVGAAIRYYSELVQGWELQALIKCRFVAGDERLARAFLHGVQPHVYHKELNFVAIKTALVSLEKIQRGHHKTVRSSAISAKAGIDVKVERGGIRDIEFLVQCLQRVYGGQEKWLRSCGTLFSLQKLHDKRHISSSEYHQLSDTYVFLRRLEHLLQVQSGQQTHRIPSDDAQCRILYKALAGPDINVQSMNLSELVRSRMREVASIYDRIVYQQKAFQQQAAEQDDEAAATALLPDQPFARLLARLQIDSAELHNVVAEAAQTLNSRRNAIRFFGAATLVPERFTEVLKHPDAVRRVLPLFGESALLADLLTTHPDDVASVNAEAHEPIAMDGSSREEIMSQLRTSFRQGVIRGIARSFEGESIWESLARHSAAADAAIHHALQASGVPDGLAVFALGRLGTCELDVLSDADLLFVCREDSDTEQITRAVGVLVEILSAYTREGIVLAIDTRLRPHGKDGTLVVTPSQLQTYFSEEAEAWEALTYSKLRFVAGDADVAARTKGAIYTLRKRFSQQAALFADLGSMRARLEKLDRFTNLKTSPGGVYDLDFLIGALALKNQVEISTSDLRARLKELLGAGLLTNDQQKVLAKTAELLRTLEHCIRIVEGSSKKWLPANPEAAASLRQLLARMIGHESDSDLEQAVKSSMHSVRNIYNSLLGN